MQKLVRYIIVIAGSFGLAACTQTWILYDAQVETGVERRPYGGCAAPFSRYNLSFDSDVKISIAVSASKNVTYKNEFFPSVIFLGLRVKVPDGQRVRFKDTTFRVKSPEFQDTIEVNISSFRLSVYGTGSDQPGYALTFEPKTELVGGHQIVKGRTDEFTDTMLIRKTIPQKLILEFPRFSVNGKEAQPAPVTFAYREESHFGSCISF